MANKINHACSEASRRKTPGTHASYENHARWPATLRPAGRRFLGGCGLVALLVMASSRSSLSEDFPGPAPASASFDWSRFYVGGSIGRAGAASGGPRDIAYTYRDHNDPYFNRDETIGNDWFIPQGASSSGPLVGGVQFGYTQQFGKMVIGAEADFNFLNAKKKYSGAAAEDLQPYPEDRPDYNYHVREELAAEDTVEWLGTIRGRVGYTPTERLLAYVTGGAAYAKVKGSGSYNYHEYGFWWGGPGDHDFDRSGGMAQSSNKIQWGWTAGAGLEYALTDAISIRGEYLFTDLGSSTHGVSMASEASDETIAWKSKTRLNIVKFGVNYRF